MRLVAPTINTTETDEVIDHETEDLIPFELAENEIPGHPSRCTLFRWAFKGVRGARLETLLIGNRRFTSREAIGRFITAQNADQTPDPSISPSQRKRQSETARKELAKIGI